MADGAPVDPADALLSTTKTAKSQSQTVAKPQSGTDPADALLGQTKTGAPPPAQSAGGGGGDESFLGNLGKNWRDEAYQAGQGALEAGAGIAGIPGMLANLGSYIGGGGHEHTFLTPGSNLKFLADEGLYNPDAQPKNLTEKMFRTGGGVAATLPLGMIPGPMEMSLGQNLLYSTVPAYAGTLANELGLPATPTALLTALGMTGVGGIASRVAARSAAEEAAAQAAKEQAAHEAAQPGFSLQQKQAATTAKAEAQKARQVTDADAMKLHDSEHVGADNDREAVASTLGQSHTMEEAGGKLQDAARSWKKTEFPQKLKDAEHNMYYNPDGSVAIPEDAIGDLSNFNSSLKNSFYKAGELEPAAQQLRSRMPERLQNALDEIAKSQGLPPGSVPKATLGDMKKLRSILGDAMTSPKLTEGVNAGQMNELYRALSGDMEGAITNAAGPAGVARFKQFNEEAKRLYHLASGPVSDLISTVDKTGETITPAQAIKNMGLTDGEKLAQLGSEPTLKNGLNEVAAANLRKGTELGDPGDVEKEFTGMKPEVKSALYGDQNAGKIQDVLDRRTQADQDLKDMQKGSKKIQAKSVEAAKAGREVELKQRSEKGVELKQKAEETSAAVKEMVDPNRNILEYLKSMGWHTLGGGSGLLAAHEMMPRMSTAVESAGFPHWVGHLGYPALALTGGLAAAGARQIARQPETVRNMLTGSLPNAPFTPSPLGWSVEKNK